VKKEKTTKDKTTRTAETSSQSAAAVDDHSKSSSADASKTDKLKDATHTLGVLSSEPMSDKSELHVFQLNNC